MTSNGYALWAVFRRDATPHPIDVDAANAGLEAAVQEIARTGVTVRGFYDVSGLRADADLMVWLHGPVPEDVQSALRVPRRTAMITDLLPTWNALGVHVQAEFSANHLPAFLKGTEPEEWLTVYPFVRSYEWYLLPDEERRAMLSEHGRRGSEHRTVLTNTVAAFTLGDYEWILALEAAELTDLVDLMRDLRATDARRHVREEIPFFTGRRIPIEEIAEVLS